MQIVQDTVELNLTAEDTVVNKTIKLVASIVALVDAAQTEETLNTEIRAALKKLVDAEWQFSNTNRSTDASGYERVEVTASVRVKESENYNLGKRAEAVSRPGLTVNSVMVDSSIPQAVLLKAESDLRVVLSKKAIEECEKLSAALGQEYRVHSLRFSGVKHNLVSNSNVSPFNVAVYYSGNSEAAAAPSGGSAPDSSLGSASKLSLVAAITLARVHAYTDSESERNKIHVLNA